MYMYINIIICVALPQAQVRVGPLAPSCSVRNCYILFSSLLNCSKTCQELDSHCIHRIYRIMVELISPPSIIAASALPYCRYRILLSRRGVPAQLLLLLLSRAPVDWELGRIVDEIGDKRYESENKSTNSRDQETWRTKQYGHIFAEDGAHVMPPMLAHQLTVSYGCAVSLRQWSWCAAIRQFRKNWENPARSTAYVTNSKDKRSSAPYIHYHSKSYFYVVLSYAPLYLRSVVPSRSGLNV